MKTKQELIEIIRIKKMSTGKVNKPLFCLLYNRTKFIETHRKFSPTCGYKVAYGFRIPDRKIILKDCDCGYWEKGLGCWYREDFDIRSVCLGFSTTIDGAMELSKQGF